MDEFDSGEIMSLYQKYKTKNKSPDGVTAAPEKVVDENVK
jgi:hypothetical protein